MKKIKILGTGCPKCQKTMELFEKSVVELGLEDVHIEKVDDIMEIMKYNVMSTPAVVCNGDIILKGRIPSKSEVLELLSN
jgi:small redox-active disulfide protein 2